MSTDCDVSRAIQTKAWSLSAHRSARPRVRLNRGHLSCAAQWMLEGSRLRGVMPKNHSPLWLRRCHRRQLPHTGVSACLEPLAFPYQHEPPPKNLAQKPTSPTHQHRHRHRRPPSAFDPTTAAQPSRREPLFMPQCRLSRSAPYHASRRRRSCEANLAQWGSFPKTRRYAP
jgi:hypothetical protein